MATSTGTTKRTRKVHQHPVTIPPTASEEIDLQALDQYDPAEDLSPERDLYLDPMDENMDQRVHIAQERLSRLRKEAEEIEREKVALEDLRRKQQGFLNGRTEMLERMSRAVALLDRETQDNRRKIEQMLVMRETFADHMDAVQSLTPEDWSRQNLQSELSRALGIIEDARMEYDRSMTRLQSYTHNPVAPVTAPAQHAASPAVPTSLLPMGYSRESFKQWAFYGLAFTAPVVGIALVWNLIARLFS
jgi:chromosome segregation ATPase